jgi:RNA polymerase primary sigma factor
MKLPHEKVRDFKKYARDAVSLETPVGEGGARYNDGDTLGDVIEDEKAENVEEAVEFTALQEALVATLDTFTEKEANIISLRFGLVDGTSWTLDDVGKLYGVTRERIRQIESKIMSKLRHPSRSHLLRDYLQ